MQNVARTEKLTLDRKDADRKFGFDLYQGGAPKGSDIRILRIQIMIYRLVEVLTTMSLEELVKSESYAQMRFKMVLKDCI